MSLAPSTEMPVAAKESPRLAAPRRPRISAARRHSWDREALSRAGGSGALTQTWEPVWAAAAETGLPINLHANPRGGSRQIGVGVTGLEPRNQSLMTVMNFPMGLMAELMSAVVLSGICDRHPRVRFVLEEAGAGWVPFLFWRFDREYDWGGAASRVFRPDIVLSDKPTEFVKRQVFFTFEVEEEGGFRRVPEVGVKNFLWASDFPGLDSPWPNSREMGHVPVEAALGKAALEQMVFANAVSLYQIPANGGSHAVPKTQ